MTCLNAFKKCLKCISDLPGMRNDRGYTDYSQNPEIINLLKNEVLFIYYLINVDILLLTSLIKSFFNSFWSSSHLFLESSQYAPCLSKIPIPIFLPVNCKVTYSFKASSNADPMTATLTHPTPITCIFINKAQPGTVPEEKQNMLKQSVHRQSIGTYCLSLTLCSDVCLQEQ